MIRRLFLTVLISFVVLNLSAQDRVDRFDSYDAMVGKEIRLYNTVSMADHQGYFVYDIENGKPKVVKNSAIYQELEKNNILVSEVVKHRKTNYLKATLKGKTIYLILNDGFNYLANARSVSYWTELNDAYVMTHSHLRVDSNILQGDYERIYNDVLMSKYVAISWSPISIPANINDEVLFRFTIKGDSNKTYTLSHRVIEQYKDDFITSEQFNTERKAYLTSNPQNVDSDTEIVTPNYDKIDAHRVFEADIELTDDAKRVLRANNIDSELGYELLFSAYAIVTKTSGTGYLKKTNQYVKGYILAHDIELPIDSVIFRHEEDKAYLISRGLDGETIRKGVAEANDAIYSEATLQWIRDYAKEIQYKLEKTQSYYRSKGILIIDQDYSYSDYQFGLIFKFFNCYNKDIKYIELKICAYNIVGDRQRDDFGRHAKEVKCIGPISPNETGIYDFDELFWDDNDIIRRLQVEKIVVTFMDNTTKTFSGKTQVDKLRLDNYPPVDVNDYKKYAVGKASDFKKFVSAINWQWTEAELITHLGYNAQRCKSDVWEDENSESNYKLDNITVCGIPIADSNIRVDKTTRKLYRMNLIVLDDAADLTLYPKIEKALIEELGESSKKNITEDRRDLIWQCDGYKIEATYWDLSDVTTKVVEKYSYIISIEPL